MVLSFFKFRYEIQKIISDQSINDQDKQKQILELLNTVDSSYNQTKLYYICTIDFNHMSDNHKDIAGKILTSVAKELLTNKQEKNIIDTQSSYGNTALHLTAIWGNTTLAKLLIKNNANLNIKDNDGNTALHLATYHGNIKITQLLLAHKAADKITNKYGNVAIY